MLLTSPVGSVGLAHSFSLGPEPASGAAHATCHGTVLNEDDAGVDSDTIWQRTVEELLANGATQAEAIEGANLIVHAYKRERRERAIREARSQSGTVRRPEQYRARDKTG